MVFFEGKSGSPFDVKSPRKRTYKAMRIIMVSSEKKTAVLSRKYNKIFRLVNAIIVAHVLSVNRDKDII